MTDDAARTRRWRIIALLLVFAAGAAVAGWWSDWRGGKRETAEDRKTILGLENKVTELERAKQDRLHREVPDVPATVEITRVVRGSIDYGPGVSCVKTPTGTRCTATAALGGRHEAPPPSVVEACPEIDWPAAAHEARLGWYSAPTPDQIAGTCQYEELTDGARSYGRIRWMASVVLFDQDGEGFEVSRGPEYVRDVDLALTAPPPLARWPRISLRALATSVPSLRAGVTYFPWPEKRFLRRVGFVGEVDYVLDPASLYAPSSESYYAGDSVDLAAGLAVRW